MTAALVVAVIAVVLAAVSLLWQAAAYFLSGPRIKVSLDEGLRGPGGGVISAPPSAYTEKGREKLVADGYTERIVAVVVRNVGRMPTTIRMWSLRFGNDALWTFPIDPENVPLPHRLDAHDEIGWYATLEQLRDLQREFLDQSDEAAAVVGLVRLGSGSQIESGNALVVRADGSERDSRRVPRWSLARAMARARRRRRSLAHKLARRKHQGDG